MKTILRWLLPVILDWIAGKVHAFLRKVHLEKQKDEQRKAENEAAAKKLEEAKDEQEIINAGSDLLRRN